MVGVPDEALERRRAQNRIAQRRFRQKRQGNRNADENRQSQETTFPLPVFPDASGLDVCFEDFVLSPSHTPTSSVSIQCPRTQPSSLVTSTMFSDLEREFARGSTVASAPVSGAAPEPGVVAETPVVQLGSPCPLEKETSMENTAVIRVETLEHSPGTLSLLGQSAARSTSSSSSSSNGSGWLGALHMAAKRGHSGIIRFLLQQNIDINERDSDGLTALMYAAAAGHEEVAELLLSQGARLSDVDNHHRSALHWAALSRHADLLRLLLRHATNDPFLIDSYDDCGQTPLHTAVDMGFEPGVSILLEFGANVHSRARKG